MNAAIVAVDMVNNLTRTMYNVLETELRMDYRVMLEGFEDGDLSDMMWDMYLAEKNELRKLTANQLFDKINFN